MGKGEEGERGGKGGKGRERGRGGKGGKGRERGERGGRVGIKRGMFPMRKCRQIVLTGDGLLFQLIQLGIATMREW